MLRYLLYAVVLLVVVLIGLRLKKSRHKFSVTQFNNLWVGAMLMTVIILFAGIVVLTLQEKDFFKPVYRINCLFEQDKWPGLSISTPVKINNVQVGKVAGATLQEDGQVLVSLEIEESFRKHIRENSVAYPARVQNLIADRILLITHGDSGKVLNAGDFLPTEDSRDLETLLDNTRELLGDARGMIQGFQFFMGHADSLLKTTMDTTTTLGYLLNSRDIYNQIQLQLGNVNSISNNLISLLSQMNSSVPGLLNVADSLAGNILLISDQGVGTFSRLDSLVRQAGKTLNTTDKLMSKLFTLLNAGEETLNQVDDLLIGVSELWLIKPGLPNYDGIELIEERAW